jgi:hypothetical protein
VPATVPSNVGAYAVVILYNSVPDTTKAVLSLDENAHKPLIGPVPIVAKNFSPGALFKNAGSLPASGTISGNKFTILLSAALTDRAT